MDDLMHQGVADLLDRLRTEELGLPSMKHEHGYAHYYVHHKTPFTYAFSPFVAPKPKDWGSHIDVVSLIAQQPGFDILSHCPSAAGPKAVGCPPG